MDQVATDLNVGATSHTTDRMTGRVEVVGRVSARHRWAVKHKLAILNDALGPASSIRRACERHAALSAAQLYSWRRYPTH